MAGFNLKKALDGHAVRTQEGQKVKLVTFNPYKPFYSQLLGKIDGEPNSWGPDGMFLIGRYGHPYNLVMDESGEMQQEVYIIPPPK